MRLKKKIADSWKSCNFAGRNKSGIRYDLPKVRAVAYRFSTTYLLHSAATIRVEIGMREHRQQDSLDFHPFFCYALMTVMQY